MKKQIGPFRLYTKEPNAIAYGFLYTAVKYFPTPHYQRRVIRVYVPEDYDEKKKYPVIYMSDGQNIVDRYTSAYGEWNIDERQHELCKKGYPSYIVVGIDCPKGVAARTLEYSFPHIDIENKFKSRFMMNNDMALFSHEYFAYLVNVIKPLVDAYFSTSSKIEETAVCGSSMGGIFATSLLTSYPDIFGAAFIYSPAYFLYDKKKIYEYMDERVDKIKNHKIYLYSGNVGFESTFKKPTIDMYHHLLDKGIKQENITLTIDDKGEHNEPTWSKHFNECIKFWFNKK